MRAEENWRTAYVQEAQELIDWYSGIDGALPIVLTLKCVKRLECRLLELETEVQKLKEKDTK